MGLLDLFRRRAKSAQSDTEADTPPCPHTALVPVWDNADDIGKDDLATSWKCSACGTSFTVEEYQSLRATEAERLRQSLQS